MFFSLTTNNVDISHIFKDKVNQKRPTVKVENNNKSE